VRGWCSAVVWVDVVIGKKSIFDNLTFDSDQFWSSNKKHVSLTI
jgi:hypothetical protein